MWLAEVSATQGGHTPCRRIESYQVFKERTFGLISIVHKWSRQVNRQFRGGETNRDQVWSRLEMTERASHLSPSGEGGWRAEGSGDGDGVEAVVEGNAGGGVGDAVGVAALVQADNEQRDGGLAGGELRSGGKQVGFNGDAAEGFARIGRAELIGRSAAGAGLAIGAIRVRRILIGVNE